jgi:uncharacterized protein YyaL (SSP411 family)
MRSFRRFKISILIGLGWVSAAICGETPLPAWLAADSPRSSDPAIVRGFGVVRWRAFGAASFAEAARTNKPVFLFVTANWNPRGKMMERVTFSDMGVAARLNDEFIPIRLNRDERPDLDVRLQQAVRALGGGNGLPLAIFLTPQGRAVHGNTFLAAEDDPISQRPGLTTVIHRLAQGWKQSAEIEKRAEELDAVLQKNNEEESTRADFEKIKTDALLASAQQLLAVHALAAAPQSGGLFPAPRAIEFSLAHFARSGDKRSLQMAESTMTAMLRGGIYDQLGGGFYRSSTDPLWIVPRFEKVLASNAELASTCLHVWQKTGDERCKRAVEETLQFWLELRDSSGQFFYGSQAGGTSDLDDGAYATWSVNDIERALHDDTDCQMARLIFDIQETGDLPATLPSRNVLFEAISLEDAAKRMKLAPADAAKRWALILGQLRQIRAQRPSPTVDKTIYLDGNALLAAVFLEAGTAMKRSEWTAQGLKTLQALLKRSNPGGALHVIPLDDKPVAAVRLQQDEAALMYACAVAFEATSEKAFLAEAENCLQRLDEKFWDKTGGGYFDRAGSDEMKGLAWRTKLYQDTTEASPNGLVALACVKLAASTGRAEFSLKARSIVEAFGAALEKLGPYGATLGTAALLSAPK